MEIKTKKAKYSIIDLGLLVNSEIKDDFSTIKRQKISEEEVIEKLRKNPTDDEIIENLSSCISLVLGVSEQCTFRCTYCTYSGIYEGERGHSQKKMDFETARIAIDLYFQLLRHKKSNRKRYNIYIGYYGGECLLEFDLIKRTIEYSENLLVENNLDKRYNILYRLTTNGYLLKDKIVDYLQGKNALVDVSFDGSEEEHDKFRLTRTGQKTWAAIMDNLRKIKERYPGYFESSINYLVTIHPHHDCKAIDSFFMQNQVFFRPENVKFNSVNIDRLNNEEKDLLIKTAGPPSELQFNQYTAELPFKFNLKTRAPDSLLTATCFPGGEKIFVSADGKLNVCEKVSHEAPGIGHVNSGFDFDNIRKIMRDYNEEIIKNRCWECEYWFLCAICIANAFRNGRFEFNCSVDKVYPNLLKKYLEKREEEDEKEYYNNNIGVADFIERL